MRKVLSKIVSFFFQMLHNLRSYNIFTQFCFYRRMSKQQVRENRERIRRGIRHCLSNSPSIPDKFIDLTKKHSSLNQIQKPRRTSQQIRILDQLMYLKETHVQNSFESMFELLQKIGQGCHTTVFKCREIKTNTFYAVKVVRSVDSEGIHHYKEHFRIKKSLNHQNVIKAKNLFINQKMQRVHMVCEYCPYKNLRDFIRSKKKIKESTIASIVHSILSGTAYLHSHCICHRDLKPQNIMYNKNTGQLKLIDFGISKMCKYINEKFQMWTNTGTLHYKAPEMFKGSYNELIDVWAIGVMTYEMVYRKLPFDKEYVCDTIQSICESEPDYQNVDLSPFLLHFMKRCLTKNAAKRMTAAQALQTPFLLRHQQEWSNYSPKKRHPFNNTEQVEGCYGKEHKKEEEMLLRKSHSEQDLLNHSSNFSDDIGIRFLND